ncbi:HAD family hydrolase [Peptostreptococcus equinus]|uniref:HAD family phosphatase n=1 Tax=Peptostreptococcus equinus TaxID=3003601 RepID=A0ABY7JNS3_9FIRM|nr:HAD family phosphatase [Peptostreptococcus sp. CBA3647]WAW15025.1 HAD family phosphatase [Peptostreptococcus sp. CBA3647]
MKNIKGVIFDVDGVIFDTERMSSTFWTKTMAKYGYKMDDSIYTQVMGRNRTGLIKGLEEIYNDSSIDFDSISREKTAAMVAKLDSSPIPVLPGVYEIVDYLEKNGYKRAIATSTREDRSVDRLKRTNLYDRFQGYMYGDWVEHSKPNPEIFLKAAEQLGLEPKECLILEDSPSGVEAAYNGGFPCINVVDFKQPTEAMKNQSIARCDGLLEVIDWLEKNNK